MSELTAPECAGVCKVPHSCCSPEYCEITIYYAAARWGVVLERTDHHRLPLMGPNGCVAEPHLRPMCTLHTCEVGAFGYKRTDQEWTEKYYALREEIGRLEDDVEIETEEAKATEWLEEVKDLIKP